jgi:hypothetical protein
VFQSLSLSIERKGKESMDKIMEMIRLPWLELELEHADESESESESDSDRELFYVNQICT